MAFMKRMITSTSRMLLVMPLLLTLPSSWFSGGDGLLMFARAQLTPVEVVRHLPSCYFVLSLNNVWMLVDHSHRLCFCSVAATTMGCWVGAAFQQQQTVHFQHCQLQGPVQ
jgi:hypothetical protein